MNCPTEEHLVEYADGQARIDDSRAIEEHLSCCGPCTRALADLRELMGAIAGGSESYSSAERRLRIMKAVETELAAAATRGARRNGLSFLWKGLAAAVAVAALAVFFVIPGEDVGFGVRGDATQETGWVGVRVLQILPGDSQPKEIAADLPRDADLLFMYTNRAERTWRWLVILARDATGKIHWLQPPPPTSAGGPRALPIRATSADDKWTGIPELVRLRPPAGPLVIGALFSWQPVPVDIVEAWMKEAGTVASVEPMHPKTVGQVITLRVVRTQSPASSP